MSRSMHPTDLALELDINDKKLNPTNYAIPLPLPCSMSVKSDWPLRVKSAWPLRFALRAEVAGIVSSATECLTPTPKCPECCVLCSTAIPVPLQQHRHIVPTWQPILQVACDNFARPSGRWMEARSGAICPMQNEITSRLFHIGNPMNSGNGPQILISRNQSVLRFWDDDSHIASNQTSCRPRGRAPKPEHCHFHRTCSDANASSEGSRPCG